MKVAVVGANRAESRRHLEADDLIGFLAERTERIRGATGTARTNRAGPRGRTAHKAIRIVAPVSMPSSTTIAVRPATAIRGRPAQSEFRRGSISGSCHSVSVLT
jgi:hypothetical protein